jgi:hypothetical protein
MKAGDASSHHGARSDTFHSESDAKKKKKKKKKRKEKTEDGKARRNAHVE